jgi:pyrroline-5-carboxylate reductase
MQEMTQMTDKLEIGIVGGGGWLAQTIIKALLAKHVITKDQLGLSYRSKKPDSLSPALVTTDSQVLVDACDTIILSVRPADLAKLKINATGKLVVSVMAGVSIEKIVRETQASRIVRALPNVAASVGCSYTPLFASKAVTHEDRGRVTRIFEACGICDEMASEEHLDYLTGLTGSGPAYSALLS